MIILLKFKNDLISLIKNSNKSSLATLSVMIRKRPDKLNEIINYTNFLSNDESISNRFYYIRNNINEQIVCLNCNNKIKTPQHNKFCSPKCCNNYNYNLYGESINKKKV